MMSDVDMINLLADRFRAPLRETHSSMLQIQTAGPLTEQQTKLIEHIKQLNSDLALLVNEVIALSQPHLHPLSSTTLVQMQQLAETAIAMFLPAAERRQQRMIIETPDDLPRVSGDEEGLLRSLSALLDNAIKYSPSGAQIRVMLSRVEQHIYVAVRDTGVGLREDEVEQVFAPFYRSPSTAYLNVPGRGIGLTIAKLVIEQHGGQIWASSTPGQGSLFALCLPVCVQQRAVPPSARQLPAVQLRQIPYLTS